MIIIKIHRDGNYVHRSLFKKLLKSRFRILFLNVLRD